MWVRARSELRRRWRATLSLTLLAGLAGGAALAGMAGARRTDSALARFVAFSRPFEVFVFDPGGAADLDAITRLPQVADAGTSAYLVLAPSTPSGQPDVAAVGSINPFVRSSETGLGATSDLPYLVEGRLPDPHQALEVTVNEEVAGRYDLEPGDSLRMWAYTPEQIDDALAGVTAPAGRPLDLTVTGVVRLPFDLDPVARDPEVIYTGRGAAYFGPAFWRQYASEVGAFGGPGHTLDLRLRPGSDVEAFAAAVRALPGGESLEVQVGSEATKVQGEAEQATEVEAAALVAFAALAAVAGLVVVGQALSRQVQLEAAEHPTLRALGMTRGQLLAAALVRALVVAGPGAALAAAVAVAASPLTPMGLARRAEVDPGIFVDVPVLVVGAWAVALVVLARAALAAWRPARLPAGGRGGSRVVERLAAARLPHPALTGVRMALDGGGQRGRAVVGTALAGTLAAAAVTTAALTFGASLDRLAGRPELHGWGWDVVVGNPNSEVDKAEEGRRNLAARPFVDGFTAVGGTLEPLTIAGLDIPAAGVELVEGNVFAPLSGGRPPSAPGEVALGGRTMARLGLAVGDQVGASLGGVTWSLQVVGRAVLHPAIQFPFTLDEGAVLSLEDLQRQNPELSATHFLVRYAEGTDHDAAFAALQADWGKTVLRAQPPVEVENLRRVAGLPGVLAGLVGTLAAGSLAHATVTSVRQHRRDLAVLKTLGYRRRDLAATVRWQSATLVVTALAAGLPLGVVAGRWAWRAATAGFGEAATATPVMAVLLAVPVALAVANLVATPPARWAGRSSPAAALRAE